MAKEAKELEEVLSESCDTEKLRQKLNEVVCELNKLIKKDK